MKTCEFDDKELDIISHALLLLKRDFKFDLETYARNSDLDALSNCIDALSLIEFILPKLSNYEK